MEKFITLSALLIFFAGCGVWQTGKNQNAGEKMKTVFLHIEGFTKSKSGAV
jgi:hypothetical protein